MNRTDVIEIILKAIGEEHTREGQAFTTSISEMLALVPDIGAITAGEGVSKQMARAQMVALITIVEASQRLLSKRVKNGTKPIDALSVFTQVERVYHDQWLAMSNVLRAAIDEKEEQAKVRVQEGERGGAEGAGSIPRS